MSTTTTKALTILALGSIQVLDLDGGSSIFGMQSSVRERTEATLPLETNENEARASLLS